MNYRMDIHHDAVLWSTMLVLKALLSNKLNKQCLMKLASRQMVSFMSQPVQGSLPCFPPLLRPLLTIMHDLERRKFNSFPLFFFSLTTFCRGKHFDA